MILLKFILFIFVVGIVMVFTIFFRLFRTLNDVRKQFRNMGRQYRREEYHEDGNGQTITDMRPADEKTKKIFADDEGEYVEFEEA